MFTGPCGAGAERSGVKRRRTASLPGEAGTRGRPERGRGWGPHLGEGWRGGSEEAGSRGRWEPRTSGRGVTGPGAGRGAAWSASPCPALAAAGPGPPRLPCAPPAASHVPRPRPRPLAGSSPPAPRLPPGSPSDSSSTPSSPELHTALPTPTSAAPRNCFQAPTRSQSSTFSPKSHSPKPPKQPCSSQLLAHQDRGLPRPPVGPGAVCKLGPRNCRAFGSGVGPGPGAKRRRGARLELPAQSARALEPAETKPRVHPGPGAKTGVSLVIAKRGLWSQKVSPHGRLMSLSSTEVLKTPCKRASWVPRRSALPASAPPERGPGAAVWRWECQEAPLRSPRDSRNLDNCSLVFDNLSPASERGLVS